MFHLSDRELYLLGQPTRNETLALVGWMALNNIFGFTTSHVCGSRELPPAHVAHWVGCLRGLKGSDKVNRAAEQNVLPNERRKVLVRRAHGQLATGAH